MFFDEVMQDVEARFRLESVPPAPPSARKNDTAKEELPPLTPPKAQVMDRPEGLARYGLRRILILQSAISRHASPAARIVHAVFISPSY